MNGTGDSQPETATDAEQVAALAAVIVEHIKQYPVTSDWRTTAGHFGATEYTIAAAIYGAGWRREVTR